MKVFIAQVNVTIDDFVGNLNIMKQSITSALQTECDVVVFPELVTTGYPPRDLLYSREFWEREVGTREHLFIFVQQQSRQITVIFGGLHEVMLSGGRHARYNSAWIYDKHFGKRVVHKRLLPCYDVFDETRYFTPADEPYVPLDIYIENDRGDYTVPCDVLICEDIWNAGFSGDETLNPATYDIDPVNMLKQRGCNGPLFIINGSPFWAGKIEVTQTLLEFVCKELNQPVIWCNQIGAHDDIVTGGYSMVTIPTLSAREKYRASRATRPPTCRRAASFQEDSLVVRIRDIRTNHSNLNEDRQLGAPLFNPPTIPSRNHNPVDSVDYEMWELYRAIKLHMHDYKRRCGFNRAVLGLSGGIDSAVVACIAAQVFGSERVTGIAMPSPYSSTGSVEDAARLAENLHIGYEVKSITKMYEAAKELFLSGGKQKFNSSLTDENIQPRLRGLILMGHSNDHDPCLVLTTGNKSEITVGYCTLYGDTCGGLAVISDLWKLQVYRLARFLNKYFDNPIPKETIDKPASAELRPDQVDTDSLPPYEILDPLLRMFVEKEMSPMQVFATKWYQDENLDSKTIHEIYRKCRNSEYKRQQMPIGPKLSKRAFGAGRRMPIAVKTTTVY